jgi:hypothetical protein
MSNTNLIICSGDEITISGAVPDSNGYSCMAVKLCSDVIGCWNVKTERLIEDVRLARQRGNMNENILISNERCLMCGERTIECMNSIDGGAPRCIVLPAAHGKTHMNGLAGLKDASGIYHTRGDILLDRLRDQAWYSGDWREYDAAWSSRLIQRCNPLDIIMLPTESVAIAGGFRILGKYVLTKDIWAQCIAERGGENTGRLLDAVARFNDDGSWSAYRDRNEMQRDILTRFA